MASALARRLRKLERIFETEKPCQCSPVNSDPVDWSLATTQELRRFVELSKASELAVPRECGECGRKTVTADKSRLSKKHQVEMQAITVAIRGRHGK